MVLRRSDRATGRQLSDRSSPDAESVVERLRASLAPVGLDLVVPFSLSWCTGCEQKEYNEQKFAVLIGNSKKLWQPFLSEWRCSRELQGSENPLDQYIENHLHSCMDAELKGLQWRFCCVSSEAESGAQAAPAAMQRLAHMIGFAYYDRTSHLCLHPKMGPWFSMRAVVMIEGIAFAELQPKQLKCPLSAQTQAYIKMAARSARTSMDTGEDQASSSDDGADKRLPQHWQKWAAVREATCPGNPWKFDKYQVEYHYTRNLAVLRKATSRKSMDTRRVTA